MVVSGLAEKLDAGPLRLEECGAVEVCVTGMSEAKRKVSGARTQGVGPVRRRVILCVQGPTLRVSACGCECAHAASHQDARICVPVLPFFVLKPDDSSPRGSECDTRTCISMQA